MGGDKVFEEVFNLVNRCCGASGYEYWRSKFEKEKSLVIKCNSWGPQFSIGSWVRDTLLHKRILSESCRPFDLLVCMRICVRDVIFLFLIFGQIFILRNRNLINCECATISYRVNGDRDRIVSCASLDASVDCEIIFRENGLLEIYDLRLLNLTDFWASLKIMVRSFRSLKEMNLNLWCAFFKDLFNVNCFLHLCLGRAFSRLEFKKVILPSEGFPREYCFVSAFGGGTKLVNMSPSINVTRLNTFISYFNRAVDLEFIFKEKQKFILESIGPEVVCKSFASVIEAVFSDASADIIFVPGYSEESRFSIQRYVEHLNYYAGMMNLSLHDRIKIKEHPRRGGLNVSISNDDFVFACVTSQFGFNAFNEEAGPTVFLLSLAGTGQFSPFPFIGLTVVGLDE